MIYAAPRAMQETGLEWAYQAGAVGTIYQIHVLELAYVVLLGWLVAWLVVSLRKLPLLRQSAVRREAFWLTSLVLLALALRLLSPSSPMDIHHRLQPAWDAWQIEASYGWGFPVAAVELWRVFGRSHEVVFTANAVIGAVTLLPLDAFARRIGLSRSARLWTALVFATLPLHIRFSHTDNQAIVETALFLVSMWALSAWAAEPRWRLALLAALTLGVAMCMRPEAGALLLVAVAWLVFVLRPRRLHRGQAAGGALVVIALASVHSLSMVHLWIRTLDTGNLGIWQMPPFGLWTPRYFIFLDPRYVTPALWLGLAVGVLARRPSRRVVIALAATAAGLALLMWGWSPSDLGLLGARHQLRSLPFAAMVAGTGFALALERLCVWVRRGWPERPRRLVRAAHPFASALLAGSLTFGLPAAFVPTTMNLEWAFFNETLPLVPRCCSIVHFAPANDRSLRTPVYLSSARRARHRWLSFDEFDRLRVGGDECLLYYRPASCYAHDVTAKIPPPASEHAPMVAECAEWEQQHSLRPQWRRQLPARSTGTDKFGQGLLEVGFYRVEDGRPPPHQAACWAGSAAERGAGSAWRPTSPSHPAPAQAARRPAPRTDPAPRWSACSQVFTADEALRFHDRLKQVPSGGCQVVSLSTDHSRTDVKWRTAAGLEVSASVVPTGCVGLLDTVAVEGDEVVLLAASDAKRACPAAYRGLGELVRSGGGPTPRPVQNP